MQNKILLTGCFLLLIINSADAQGRGDRRGAGGIIMGEVHDQSTNAPIEYANVILFSSETNAQVTGSITDPNGRFEISGIRPGSYFINVQFIGYEKVKIDSISITPSNLNINLGKIVIHPTAINLGNVEVRGERNPVTYQIDKKVIDVTQMQTAVSGNAAEVLENVPSITVDIEGNISLRGSSNFTVLVDGRPSVVDPQDILQQTPAEAIQKIEIITNPSAKYDAEGDAGIINIILKKNTSMGLSGIINANAGFNEKYGGGFLFEYKTSLANYNFGINYDRRIFPGTSRESRRYIFPDSTSFLNSEGTREWGRRSFNIRGGVEFNLGENDKLNFGARAGSRKFGGGSASNYVRWTDAQPSFYYLSHGERSRSGDFYDLNLNYYRYFGNYQHRLSTEFVFSHDYSDELTLSSELENGIQFSGKKTTEFGPESELEWKIDYTLPFSDISKFEAGVEGEIEDSEEGNGLYEYNTLSGNYEFRDLFSNTTMYNQKELSMYSTYADEFGSFGIQGGLRSEYTYSTVQLKRTGEKFSIDEWDIFPTLHASYKFDPVTQIMGSYTRRIRRPGGWQLEPFYTWMDANNVRIGNPAIKPQYIDSYEAGFQTAVLEVSFTNEFYYRMTHNRVDEVLSIYPDADNVTLHSLDNIGNDYSAGSEFTFMFDPFEFWSVDLMANLYNYKIKGMLNNTPFSRESFNWNTRFNNSFKLFASTQVQFNTRYNSPTVSSQGKREGFFSSDISLKQDLMNRQLTLILQVRDIFGSAKFESTSQGDGFYTYNYFNRESPVVMLNLRFNFNSYKEERPRTDGEQEMNNNGGGEEF